MIEVSFFAPIKYITLLFILGSNYQNCQVGWSLKGCNTGFHNSLKILLDDRKSNVIDWNNEKGYFHEYVVIISRTVNVLFHSIRLRCSSSAAPNQINVSFLAVGQVVVKNS